MVEVHRRVVERLATICAWLGFEFVNQFRTPSSETLDVSGYSLVALIFIGCVVPTPLLWSISSHGVIIRHRVIIRMVGREGIEPSVAGLKGQSFSVVASVPFTAAYANGNGIPPVPVFRGPCIAAGPLAGPHASAPRRPLRLRESYRRSR